MQFGLLIAKVNYTKNILNFKKNVKNFVKNEISNIMLPCRAKACKILSC